MRSLKILRCPICLLNLRTNDTMVLSDVRSSMTSIRTCNMFLGTLVGRITVWSWISMVGGNSPKINNVWSGISLWSEVYLLINKNAMNFCPNTKHYDVCTWSDKKQKNMFTYNWAKQQKYQIFCSKQLRNSCWLEFTSEINKHVALNNAMWAGIKLLIKYLCEHGYSGH